MAVYFNYEASECENPINSPSSNSMLGAVVEYQIVVQQAVNNTSDFHLVDE